MLAMPGVAFACLQAGAAQLNGSEDAAALASTAGTLPPLKRLDEQVADALRLGREDEARALLESAVQMSAGGQKAAYLVRLGNYWSIRDQFEVAASHYREALQLTENGADVAFIDASVNLARVLEVLLETDEANTRLLAGLARLQQQTDGAWKASRLAAVGELFHKVALQTGETRHLPRAIGALEAAAVLARNHQAPRAEASAIGYLGAIAQQMGEVDKAVDYTRVAILLAKEAEVLDELYLWHWQAARLFEEQGQTTQAIASYQLAIDTLDQVRSLVSQGSTRTFERNVSPLFFSMANLLLAEHQSAQSPEVGARFLLRVRDTIERLKVAEIEDYFNDECVVGDESQLNIEAVGEGVAIVYPILFNDRMEVLTSIGDQVIRHTADVSRGNLVRTVSSFRRGLVRRATKRYQTPGKRLYQWLVGPIVEDLRQANVDTLVFVPDGPLRTVPPAALFDGEKFLIEEFAVSSSLGLTLTSPRSIAREEVQVLAAGLTEKVTEEFSALPAVASELEQINQMFTTKQLRDQAFRVDPVADELSAGNYGIVHIATHGKFESNYKDSFLLAYDGRITMDSLERTVGMRRYLNEPVELLMLSACETAVGDDRAALGLAGIALKAGVRSAVATLWSVSDVGTSRLVAGFYGELQDQSQSKAQALRAAQIRLLQSEELAHPFFWSPYLLVGNWL